MSPLTRYEKIFFVVIFISAIVIALSGIFVPAALASALSWLELPPLHARFVAAIYLFGTITMLAALLVRQWSQVRTVLLLIAIFTGGLIITSFLNVQGFDFSKPIVWLWFVTYTSYPVIALILLWNRSRGGANGVMTPASLPTWIRSYLLIQGVIVGLVAVVLLFFPDSIVPLWPWKITPRLAQFYSGPLLAYAVGSLIFAIRSTLHDMKIIAPAMLGFTATTLIASMIHSSLFSFAEVVDVMWFILFAVGTVLLALVTIRTLQTTPAYQSATK